MSKNELYESLKGLEAFRIEDLPASIRQRPYMAQELHYLESTGRLRRVRRGAYIVVPVDEVNQPVEMTDPFVAASVLARPYAVSFHSALALRGLAEGVSRRVYIQSPKQVRRLEFAGAEFIPVRVKILFGVETIYRRTVGVQVTDTERTLLDCLRCPQYAGGLDEFLRSIEGVECYDLLSAILDWYLDNNDKGHGRLAPPEFGPMQTDNSGATTCMGPKPKRKGRR